CLVRWDAICADEAANQCAGSCSCPTFTPTPTATPRPAPIRGNRKAPSKDRTGCQVDWYVTNPGNPLDYFGLPSARHACTDGDPTCDFERSAGMCGFDVQVCLNNARTELPACTPNGISAVTILGPRPERGHTPLVRDILAADVAALQDAVQHLQNP